MNTWRLRILREAAVWRRLRLDPGLLAIVLLALLLRVDLAGVRTYVHDEANTAIPLASTISFAPGSLNLPLRGENHGALPAYVVKTSRTLFGTTRLGTRLLHVFLGVGATLLVALVAFRWYGAVAARWAAALLAFNEYFFTVSARATAHAPYLFFVAAAIYAFSRFLASERTIYLYGSAAALGVAFYSKEHAALLLPLLMLTFLRAGYRHWLRTPHAYLACALFLAVVAADVAWNVTTDRETARITYGEGAAGYATYASHLERIGGLGFSPYPLMFYARSLVRTAYAEATGQELRDATVEYPSVNPALGLLLLGSVLLMTLRRTGVEPVRGMLAIVFWGIFGFFSLIEPGDPPGRLDAVSWIWVESTLLPACILTGAWLAGLSGRVRLAIWTCAGVVLLYGGWMAYR